MFNIMWHSKYFMPLRHIDGIYATKRPLGPQHWENLILISAYWATVVPALISASYIMS